MKENVKKIEFRVNLEGNGIVNFDDNSIKDFAYAHDSLKHLRTKHNNVKYAKRNLYDNGDGTLTQRIKISSNSLRYHLFRDVNPAQSPNIVHEPMLLYPFIASPEMMVRGYMFTDSKSAIKKKSALTIVDAEQTCSAMPKLEFFTRSGEKLEKQDGVDTSDTSIFNIETVGNINYSSNGDIDLEQLQFVSGDDIFDRNAFNPDYFEGIMTPFLKKRFPNFDSKLDYYMLNTSLIRVPEFGFKFSDENVVLMVKNVLKRLLTLSLNKNTGFAKCVSLDVRFITDPVEDIKSEWTTFSTNDEIEAIDFKVQEYYTLASEEEAANRPLMEDIKEEVAKVAKAKSALKKAEKLKAEKAKAKAEAKANAAKSKKVTTED